MTPLRIRIARWLAPEVFREIDHARMQVSLIDESRDMWQERANFSLNKVASLRRALRNIASLRTPSCAHIGKRMADIADAALKDTGLLK